MTAAGNKSRPAAPADPRLRFLSGGLLAAETHGGFAPRKLPGSAKAQSRRKDVPAGSRLRNGGPALPTRAPRAPGRVCSNAFASEGRGFSAPSPFLGTLGSKYLLAAAGEGQDAELQTEQIPAPRLWDASRTPPGHGALFPEGEGASAYVKGAAGSQRSRFAAGAPLQTLAPGNHAPKQVFPAAPPGAVSAAESTARTCSFYCKKAGGSGSGFALVAAGPSAPRSSRARGGGNKPPLTKRQKFTPGNCNRSPLPPPRPHLRSKMVANPLGTIRFRMGPSPARGG